MSHKRFRLLAVTLCAVAVLGLPLRDAGAQERSLGTGSETTKEAGDVTKGRSGGPETAIGARPIRPNEDSNETRSLPQGPDPADANTPNARNSYPRQSPQR